MEEVGLYKNYGFKKIAKATIAPILMMIFSSIYSVVDGFFISFFVGSSAFSGVNLIMPIIMIIGGVGFMLGAGGTALVSKKLGEGKDKEASDIFSMIALTAVILGILISIVVFFFVEDLVRAMASVSEGSSEEMIRYASTYGRILVAGQLLYILQNTFQSLLAADNKQNLAFMFTLIAGLTNIALDALFIIVFKWDVVGAAVATLVGYAIGGIGPIIYYALINKNGKLKIRFVKLQIRPILQAMWNGSSEFASNISSSVVSIVYNIQLLKLYGENGVSAYGALMYVSFIFIAIFYGYNIGLSPAIAYNYGAGDKKEATNLLNRSLIFVGVAGLLMSGCSILLSTPLGKLFSSGNADLAALTASAMKIYSLCFIFAGFSLFLSSFFTALNNGLISALISILRTFCFQIAFVFIMPAIIGKEGIWWSAVGAEITSIILSFIFLLAYRKRYGYWTSDNQKNG